jgi:hypothetical protein
MPRIGLLEVTEICGWGPLDRECRRGHHRWTPLRPVHYEGDLPEWERYCPQCGWAYFYGVKLANPDPPASSNAVLQWMPEMD